MRPLAIGLAGLAMGVLPRAAEACTWCLSSAFGDRSFNWPYLGLILAPFLVGVTISGVLAWHAGIRPSALMRRLAVWPLALPRVSEAPSAKSVAVTKETT
jgi:hypothetical protein